MLPIGEDNGIVEWVPNTRGMRHCLADTYAAAGLYEGHRTNRAIQRIWEGSPQVRARGAGVRQGGGSVGGVPDQSRLPRPALLPSFPIALLACTAPPRHTAMLLHQDVGRFAAEPSDRFPSAPRLPNHPFPCRALSLDPPSPPLCCKLQNRRRAEVLDEVLQNWPALFHRWQLGNFTEPAAWLNARLAYTRTAGGCWGGVGGVAGGQHARRVRQPGVGCLPADQSAEGMSGALCG